MSEQRFLESNKPKELLENPLFEINNNNYDEFSNEYNPFFDYQNNIPRDEPFSNFNDNDIYFYNYNTKITEINCKETIKEKENEEKNNNINNVLNDKYKHNPFIQTKVIIEKDFSRNKNLEKNKNIETTDLTNKKLENNISQEKQNENIKQIDSNLNKINLTNLSQTLKYIQNNEFLGKKRKNDYITFNDGCVKKVRILAINSIIAFINQLIRIVTNNNIGKGICEQQLVQINKKDLTHSSVEEDKIFLNKKLKEILSSTSKKYSQFLESKNKELIEDLINSEDNGKLFQELFDLSFLDCLEHINDKKNIKLLNGFPTIDEIIQNKKKKLSKNDIDKLKSCFENYEELVKNRKPRKSKNHKE